MSHLKNFCTIGYGRSIAVDTIMGEVSDYLTKVIVPINSLAFKAKK